MKIFIIMNGVATMDSFLDCYTDYPIFFGREGQSERRAGDGGNALIRPGQAEWPGSIASFPIAMTVVAAFIYFAKRGVKADLTMALLFMLSFFLSALNHAYQAIFKGNRSRINIMRPVLTLALILALIYPIIKVWN